MGYANAMLMPIFHDYTVFQGGEVFQESIWANLSDETVHLELQQPDGSIVVQFIDFKNVRK
jgi:hypothetical protein